MKLASRIMAGILLVTLALSAADDPKKKEKPKAVRPQMQRVVATPQQRSARIAARRQLLADQLAAAQAQSRAETISGIAGTLTGMWIRHMWDNRAQNGSQYTDTHSNPGSTITYEQDRPAFGDFGGNHPGTLPGPTVTPVYIPSAPQAAPEITGVKTTSSGVRIIGLE